jgi:hypothetical protein
MPEALPWGKTKRKASMAGSYISPCVSFGCVYGRSAPDLRETRDCTADVLEFPYGSGPCDLKCVACLGDHV